MPSDPTGNMPTPLLSYTSLNADTTPASLGWGWSLNLNLSVVVNGDGDLFFDSGNGSFERWTPAAGVWVPAHRDNRIEAAQNADGSFTLLWPDPPEARVGATGNRVK